MTINHEDLNLDALEATAKAVCVPEAWTIWHDLDHQGFKTVGDAESYAEMKDAGEADECDPIAHVYTDDLAEHIATFDPPTVLALIARLREAEAARDEFKRLFSECHPVHLAGMTAAREARQELREAEAVIEQVRAKLPGPRTFAESMSRDFAGNLWPRNVDADEIAAILATYKTTNQEEP